MPTATPKKKKKTRQILGQSGFSRTQLLSAPTALRTRTNVCTYPLSSGRQAAHGRTAWMADVSLIPCHIPLPSPSGTTLPFHATGIHSADPAPPAQDMILILRMDLTLHVLYRSRRTHAAAGAAGRCLCLGVHGLLWHLTSLKAYYPSSAPLSRL